MSQSPAKATASKEEAQREAPVIKPAMVRLQDAGGVYKTVVVNLPDGFLLQDLNDHPEIWKLVQTSRSGIALCEDDKVEMRAAGWTAFAKVNYSDHERVVLYGIKKDDKPKRELSFPSNETYEVRRATDGYTYFRKRDGERMSVASYERAEAAWSACMREQYPARVA